MTPPPHRPHLAKTTVTPNFGIWSKDQDMKTMESSWHFTEPNFGLDMQHIPYEEIIHLIPLVIIC